MDSDPTGASGWVPTRFRRNPKGLAREDREIQRDAQKQWEKDKDESKKTRAASEAVKREKEKRDKGLAKEKQKHVKKYRQERGIHFEGLPYPVESLDETKFPKPVIEKLLKVRCFRPTPIQAQVWPIVPTGRDLLGVADRGSGKTLAYMLPIIHHLYSHPEYFADGPSVVVLAPDVKLAREIQKVCRRFAEALNIKGFVFNDYVSKKSHWTCVGKGYHMLITTPLDLMCYFNWGKINLKRVRYLVFDGIDQFLDNNRADIIHNIVNQISLNCQRLFFSANCPEKVDNLAKQLLRKYCKVVIRSPTLEACDQLRQVIEVVGLKKQKVEVEEAKKQRLLKLVRDISKDGNKILILMPTRKSCPDIRNLLLNEIGFQANTVITADEAAVCNIDRRTTKYVINYDFPRSLDDYVYRVKLSIAGEIETLYTFFTAANVRFAKDLISFLKKSNQSVPDGLVLLSGDAPCSGRIVIPESLQPFVSIDDELDPKDEPVGQRYPIEPTSLNDRLMEEAAYFTIVKMKKKKNRELHFVRVLDAYKQEHCSPLQDLYLTFAAVEYGEVKAWGAIIRHSLIDDKMKIKFFGLLNCDGTLSKLIGGKLQVYTAVSVFGSAN